MSSRFKSRFVNIFMLAVSTLFALLTVEVIVRIVSQTQTIMPTHQKLFVEHDPLLGWRKIPNATGVHGGTEYMVRETLNSKGLRGPEYPYEKPEQEYRILILGDSFAEGYTVSFHELFSEVLQRHLVHPYKQVEVINAGTGGYSTDQEVLFFSQEGKKYTPDLTVLLFYQNDVWYNGQTKYWRGFKPRFELAKNGTLSLAAVPVPLPAAESHVQKLKGWLRDISYLYRLVRERVKNSPALNSMAFKVGLADNGHVISKEFEVFQTQESHQYRELWRLTEALLLKLRDDVASAGSRLLIFYVPFRASIYDDIWEKMKGKYGWQEGEWDPERPGIVLQEICERNGLEYLNPTARFRQQAPILYFLKDGHWNPTGNRLVGEVLADFIATNIIDE